MDKDFYTPQDVMANRLLNVEQVAKRLQVSKMTIYRYLKTGKIEAYKIGKEYRIKESDLEKFLEKVKKESSL
jgi:excisionase family DNA binding protein